MDPVINFNMINNINNLLIENNINYSVHIIGGCATCGIEVRNDGNKEDTVDIEIIKDIINEYLKSKYIRVTNNDYDPYILYADSLFNFN